MVNHQFHKSNHAHRKLTMNRIGILHSMINVEFCCNKPSLLCWIQRYPSSTQWAHPLFHSLGMAYLKKNYIAWGSHLAFTSLYQGYLLLIDLKTLFDDEFLLYLCDKWNQCCKSGQLYSLESCTSSWEHSCVSPFSKALEDVIGDGSVEAFQ